MTGDKESPKWGLVPVDGVFPQANLMGKVLSADAHEWLVGTIEQAHRIRNDEGGNDLFVAVAREGVRPVLITGEIDEEGQEVVGSVWFGQKGKLPQRLDVSFTSMGPEHQVMQNAPVLIDGLCDALEDHFVESGSAGESLSVPDAWKRALGEVARLFDSQQQGKSVTVLHSTAERGDLDEGRIIGLERTPKIASGVLGRVVKAVFRLDKQSGRPNSFKQLNDGK